MRYVPRDQPLLLKRSPLEPTAKGSREDDEELIISLFQITDEKKVTRPLDILSSNALYGVLTRARLCCRLKKL